MKTENITHYVYKITNLSTNEIALGITTINSTKIEDGFEKYRSQLKASINQSDNINFTKEILSAWETKEETQKEASRIRTKIYNTLKSLKLSPEEKLNILTNNLFDKNSKLTKDNKREYQKKYSKENKDRLQEYRKNYTLKNKDKIKQNKQINKVKYAIQAKKHYENIKYEMNIKWKEQAAKYRESNREEINIKQNVYYKKKVNKLATDKILEGNNGDDWIFYTLEFTHKILGFKFFKYGITYKTIHMRYRQGGYSDFDFKIIDYQFGDKEYIKSLERKHLNATLANKFTFPIGIEFGGKTECRILLANTINIV